MNFKFLDKLVDLIEGVHMNVWLVVAVSAVAAAFLLGLILALSTGNLGKFKSGVKKLIKSPSSETAKTTAKEMPLKIRKMFKSAKLLKCKPSDVIGIDACVNTPFALGFASKFSKFMIAATAFITALFFGIAAIVAGAITTHVFLYSCIVLVIGMVFSFLSAIISTSIYHGGVKMFNFYVEILDALDKDEKALADNPNEIEDSKIMDAAPVDIPVEKDIQPKIEAQAPKNDLLLEKEMVAETIVEEVKPVFAAKIIEPQAAPKVEVVEEKPATISPIINGDAVQAINDKIEKEQSEVIATAPKAEKIVAQDHKQEPLELEKVAAVKTEANTNQTIAASNTDSIIARINQIKSTGAPLSTMKEIAILLQQERKKPENTTPEQQRKLNEALASLLKAMSVATRQ